MICSKGLGGYLRVSDRAYDGAGLESMEEPCRFVQDLKPEFGNKGDFSCLFCGRSEVNKIRSKETKKKAL